MNVFEKELQDKIDCIDKIIYSRLIDTNVQNADRQSLIYEAMNYSVMAGGKRLRPLLLWEVSRLFGGEEEETYSFLTAIELVHTYSLVHDDLPAIDNDEYRRGRKTTHVVYGEAMGIFAGDALLNYAFETAVSGIKKAKNKDRAIEALEILAKKAGVYGMLGGQVVDIQNEGQEVDIDTLDYINELKTGALIEAAMMMGAVLAGAGEEEVAVVERAASEIGRAFQIQDDILDVTGKQEMLGKPVMSDEKNHKTTYVKLLGTEGAAEQVKQLTQSALSRLQSLERKNTFLEQLIESLIYRKK